MSSARPRFRSLRRSLHLRAIRLWLPRLRRRFFFLFGGIAVGALAVAMAVLADQVQTLFAGLHSRYPLAPFLVTPAGFALAAWLAGRYFANAGGSGIPQVIAAHQMTEPADRDPLVSLKVGAGKILLLLLGLACGASSGREGPTVQVGASVMYALGRLAPHRQSGLLIAGSAAGIAAAFNAPLAGIIFGIEEMSRSFETRTSGLILGTVIAAGLTSLGLVGDYAYFGTTPDTLPFGAGWLAVPVMGLAGGFLGGLFSRILIEAGKGFPGAIGRTVRARPIAFAALCGFGVAVCGASAAGSIFGTGYEEAKAILHGQSHLPWTFGPLKFVATTLSSISGIPGGIFAPSLAVGAGMAWNLHHLLPATPIGALTILGMVSYLSGVVQAPITSFVIVSEMTEEPRARDPHHDLRYPGQCRVEADLSTRHLPHAGAALHGRASWHPGVFARGGADLRPGCAAMTGTGAGILLYSLGVLLFAVNDALGKWLVGAYGVGELLALRSIGAAVVLGPLLWYRRPDLDIRGEWRPHVLRVLCMAADSFSFYFATRTLPLADVMTFYLAAPLIITAMSVPVLGEKVGPFRWGAVVLGFVGVVVALQPTGASLSPAALVALFGSSMFAGAITITRKLRRTDWLTLTASQFAGAGLIGAALSGPGWATPTPVDLALMFLVGLVSMGCFVCITRALTLAPASLLAPFQYASIIWAVMLGWAVWGDVPGSSVVMGSALIVGSGLTVLWREGRRHAARAEDLERVVSRPPEDAHPGSAQAPYPRLLGSAAIRERDGAGIPSQPDAS